MFIMSIWGKGEYKGNEKGIDMLRKIILGIFLVVIPGSQTAADTFYISNSGTDANNGQSVAQPWQTLGYACNQLYPGDVLLIMGGTWDENNDVPGWDQNGTLVPRRSGSLGNPIVFKAHPGYNRPVFRGSTSQPYRYAIAICGVNFIVLDSLIATAGLRGIHIQAANFVTVKNCVSHHSRSPGGDNGGGFFIGYTDPVYACSVYACSIYSNWDFVDNDGAENVSGIHAYRNTKSVFQDNVIWDHTGGGNGIRLKVDCDSCIVRRNIILNASNGIRIEVDCDYNEIYDNVIYNMGGQCIMVYSFNRYDHTTHNIIFNNTIYGDLDNIDASQSGINIGRNPNDAELDAVLDLWVFNNIIVDVTEDRDNLFITNKAHDFGLLDYNCYWNPNGDLKVIEWKGTDYTLSQFQNNHALDLHSVNVDPGFVDAENYDFRLADSTSVVATSGRGSFYTPLGGWFNRSFMGAAKPLGWQGEPPEEDHNSPAAITDLGLTEASEGNLAAGISANVSGTYVGYSPQVITDGTIDPYGEEAATWASNESYATPHWIALDFGATRSIEKVVIYWAWNSYSNNWTTSQQYYIQRWNGSDYVNIGVVNGAPAGAATTTDIPTTSTSRIRIYQPANMGPSSYPSIIWLTELEVYGN